LRKTLIKKFNSEFDLINFFIDSLKKFNDKSKIRIGVSGGSVSEFLINNIKSLERYCKDNLVYIQLILIDERCVKFENNLRNDKKYINELKNSKYITFHNPFKNPKLKYFLYPIEKLLRKYDELDIVLMGFGLDGHTAGIFDKKKIFSKHDYIINQDNNDLRRVSFSLNYLNNSKKIVLFSTGNTKYEFFKKIKNNNNYILNSLNYSECLFLII
tara:strand:+ start:703 stop:1344 length:642 start_codon:yes stop_codon:yes gene_type:complete